MRAVSEADEKLPLETIRARTRLPAGPLAVRQLGTGHIHDTWLVEHETDRVVVQRVNRDVFVDLEILFANARFVERHLTALARDGKYPLRVPTHRPDPDGRFGWYAEDGSLWRAYEYLDGTAAIERVATKAQALDASWGFGTFAAAFADVDPSEAGEPIPEFHDLSKRFAALQASVEEDTVDRLRDAGREVDFCFAQGAFVEEVAQLVPELPARIGHNDTKVSNLLFDAETGDAAAVVDLDTVGPGRPMFDFGDMIRSYCPPVPEDATRLDHVGVRENVFSATVEGYLAAMGKHLSSLERYSLWVGAKTMCLMVGIRFLTDFLDGDAYFRVDPDRPSHNLDRARNQLKLYRELEKREPSLQRAIVSAATG